MKRKIYLKDHLKFYPYLLNLLGIRFLYCSSFLSFLLSLPARPTAAAVAAVSVSAAGVVVSCASAEGSCGKRCPYWSAGGLSQHLGGMGGGGGGTVHCVMHNNQALMDNERWFVITGF